MLTSAITWPATATTDRSEQRCRVTPAALCDSEEEPTRDNPNPFIGHGARQRRHAARRRSRLSPSRLGAPARGREGAAARVQLEQKLKLVARLVSDSPSAQRIATSGNAEAVAHLDEGRVHHALAADLLAKGDLAGARKAADHALHHLSMARRSVPDAPASLCISMTRGTCPQRFSRPSEAQASAASPMAEEGVIG